MHTYRNEYKKDTKSVKSFTTKRKKIQIKIGLMITFKHNLIVYKETRFSFDNWLTSQKLSVKLHKR